MAKPGAVIDIVGAKAGAHQLLKEISFFVRALGRAEAGERIAALRVADFLEARRGAIERLFPARLAEMRPRTGWIDVVIGILRHAILADERHHQPIAMGDVIEAEAALDAESLL